MCEQPQFPNGPRPGRRCPNRSPMSFGGFERGVSGMLSPVVIILLGAQIVSAATVERVQFSKVTSDNNCNPGPASTTFQTTDANVFLHADLNNVVTGETFRAEWARPDG